MIGDYALGASDMLSIVSCVWASHILISRFHEDDSMEMRKIEHKDSGDELITTTTLDFEGNILTCLTDCGNWVRDGSVKLVEMILPSPTCLALYQEGRLEKLLKQERYRKQEVFTDFCRDLLQHILLNKPEKPLVEIKG